MKRNDFLYLMRQRYMLKYFEYSMYHKADAARKEYDFDEAQYFAGKGRCNRAAAAAVEDIIYELTHGNAEDVATLDTVIGGIDDVAKKDVAQAYGSMKSKDDLEEFVEKLEISTLEE